MLSIQLLGTPQILLDNQPLAITRKKSRALLFYLAAHDKPLTREQLLAFFWPDTDRASAQQVLRTTLHHLRQALGTSLTTDDHSVALAPDVQVDVRDFEAQLTPPASARSVQLLTATLQIYRGDFLTGFILSDSPEFDDWVTEQQEHYRRLAIRGYIALANLREQQQNFHAALEALDHALAFDPLQEDVQRDALRLHYLAGDRAGAIRRYEALRKLLDEEMGVPPMAETRALYDAIINDTLARPPAAGHPSAAEQPRPMAESRSPALPFTGRDAELQALSAAATAHQLALVEGEPGIGKTRLAVEYLRARDSLTLIGAAHELESALPYQPIVEALRTLLTRPDWLTVRSHLQIQPVWSAEIARLVPELTENLVRIPETMSVRQQQSSLDLPISDESRLWEGVYQFLVALAREQRVVLFLDDLQWADASTLALLGYLVRSSAASNASLVFVAAARPIGLHTPLATLLQTLTRAGRLLRIPLDRLSPADTTALARQISPTYAYPLSDWLVRQAEGNPFIISALIDHARESGILQAGGALNLSALSSQPIVPPSIYELIQSRLARLSDPARRILDAAVAAGRVFEFDVVARAAALSESAALDALDELRSARLIEPQGTGGLHYTFDHSLTMEVAYREVGEPRHRLLHRRVAEAMEMVYGRQHLDSIAGVLAWHYTEGGDIQRAAPYAYRAAQLATQIAAWQEAIGFYNQALEAELPDAERAAMSMELGEAHFRAGELAQASEAYRIALNLFEPDSLAADQARLALARARLGQARYVEAIDLVRQVRDAGRPQLQVTTEMQWGTVLSVEGADLAGAAEHLHRAEALLQQSAQPDLERLAQIKFELGSVAAQQGDLAKAVELYRETITVSTQAGAGALLYQVLGHNNLAYHLHLQDDPTAIDDARQGLQLAQERGVLGLQPYLFSTLGEIRLAQGDLDAAEKYFDDGLALAERLSMPERIAGLTANLGLVAQRRGNTALAIHRLSTALAQADALGLKHLATQIRLWLAPLLPIREARAYLSEARAIAESSGRKRLLAEAIQLEQQLRPIGS